MSDAITEEERINILFEKKFRCELDIDNEKRDYIFNCLCKTTALKDQTLVDLILLNDDGFYRFNGSTSSNKGNSIISGEVYDENNRGLLYWIDSKLLNGDKNVYTIERFIRKGNHVTHLIHYNKDSFDVVGEYNISELNFVETEKKRIK